MNSGEIARFAELRSSSQLRVAHCIELHIVSTTQRPGRVDCSSQPAGRDTRTAATVRAQLLEGTLAALVRRSMMEFLQELKLCKGRGRRQLTFFEARHLRFEQELFIAESCA